MIMMQWCVEGTSCFFFGLGCYRGWIFVWVWPRPHVHICKMCTCWKSLFGCGHVHMFTFSKWVHFENDARFPDLKSIENLWNHVGNSCKIIENPMKFLWKYPSFTSCQPSLRLKTRKREEILEERPELSVAWADGTDSSTKTNSYIWFAHS